MGLLASLLFAISANMDNFTVGLVYGIKKIRIGVFSNLIIALITGMGTLLSMSLGLFICRFVSVKVSNILGSAILIILGLYFILDYYRDYNSNSVLKNPEKADENKSGDIDIKEAFALAMALSMNNMALGIGASITGLNVLVTTVFTTFFSIVFIITGFNIGKSCFPNLLCKYSPLASAIIIIILGLHEMFK